VLTVRSARPEDAADIVRVNVDAWRRAYAGIVPADALAAMNAEDRVPRYRERISQPSEFENLVAVDGERVVGYVCLGPYRVGQREGMLSHHIGEILAIYVDPPRWGTGAGRALMEAALDRLTKRGFHSVRLWVLTDNRQARRFYELAGFAADGARASYPLGRPDGSVVDLPELRYARQLP
jgi:ribosomal protein S18 acetylase RimI-like enzyme